MRNENKFDEKYNIYNNFHLSLDFITLVIFFVNINFMFEPSQNNLYTSYGVFI